MIHQYMAPWVPTFTAALEAEAAARENKPPFTVFYLATVDKDGFPKNRTLVHRGSLFNNTSNNVMIFCTDKRMQKYKELLANDKFEAVYYLEKVRKQFRFRGRARIIDSEHHPILDSASIPPRNLISSVENSSDDDSDAEDGETAEPLSLSVQSSQELPKSNGSAPLDPQSVPLNYPLVSPAIGHQIAKEQNNHGASYANLQDIPNSEVLLPSKEDWDAEVLRVWNDLSKSLKSSFRKPEPGSTLDDGKQKSIDKISRGVDGKGEDSGLKNFAVVAMFVETVDYYEMEKDRRYIYEKDETHVWSEHEVCP